MPDTTPTWQELISKHDLWNTTGRFVTPVKPFASTDPFVRADSG
jgi:hypothetical protein